MDAKIKNLAQALYDELEDQNYHSVCALINWIFNLYPTRYYGDCISSAIMVENLPAREVKIRDGITEGWKVEKHKMVLKFNKVK